jgi:hypothetical protein
VKPAEFINHTGGAEGSDFYWETAGATFGVKTIVYSFANHAIKHIPVTRINLTDEDFELALPHVKMANKTLKRNFLNLKSDYVRKLLLRDWFQVKNSNSIFAIAKSISGTIVEGGTGWAVQMAMDNHKPIYVFDQPFDTWYAFNYDADRFEAILTPAISTFDFAGIGTRDLKPNGERAIRNVYDKTFCNSTS